MRPSRSVSGLCGGRCAKVLLAGALLGSMMVAAASAVHAQDEADRRPEQLLPEAPPPPRILDEERARQRTPGRNPGESTPGGNPPEGGTDERPAPSIADTALAPPAPSIGDTALAPQLAAPRPDAADDLDEILVVGTALRLPDLGSSLRARREAEREEGRITVTFLPLYDPEAARAGFDDPLFRNREMERVGFIDLFNIRFGKRSR